MNKKCCAPLDLKLLPLLFSSLADPNRISILFNLCDCFSKGQDKVNVKEISKCCSVDLSVVSRHLKKLKDGGILESEKKGKEVFYKLKGKELANLLRNLAEHIDTSCHISKEN